MTAATQRPLRIGLTGGIGSGKSTAAQLFAALGVPVFDADELTRELTAPGQPALRAIRDAFGDSVLDADGHLSRAALRQRIFNDDSERQRLEAILHPLVYQALAERSASQTADYVIWVVPLLLETGAADQVDRVVVVDCPEALQIQRASQRDGQDSSAIQQIMQQQLSRQQRLQQADDVLMNDADNQHLSRQVERLHQYYRTLAGQKNTDHISS
ncbi:dephospho-CoA kinase [Methylohalomonas lacus]|uniref:Dephospho-CoA kinase n=1 Tax=Methylohalomonas lacus TaxID=398773 RepID=A0AAE3L5S1_9GAMM|nr:dephospho-CoA kinase [Methylohalomonas lacus]MCS3903867.1 dephospho-CoA kinase [Methylohalomonas lacus]